MTKHNFLPVVIAFFGEQQVGKSTHADYIVEKAIELFPEDLLLEGNPYTSNCSRLALKASFAAPLKERSQILLPHMDVYRADKNEPRPELGGMSLRELWQKDGQALREDPFVSADSECCLLTSVLVHKVLANRGDFLLACVDDMRHNDEYHMLSQLPHLFVRLESDKREKQYGTDHESELYWKKFVPDLILVNDKTRESLKTNCELITERAITIWRQNLEKLNQKT